MLSLPGSFLSQIMGIPQHATYKAVKRQHQRLALEPRLLFDGAAVAHAVAVLADSHAQATPPVPVEHHEQSMTELAAALSDGHTATQAATHEIVFIDRDLPHLDALLANVPAGTETVLLDPNTDGLAQIASALANRSGITALHIVTHGSESHLQIGDSVLDSQTITGQYAEALQSIGTHLSVDADVLVYGCDFGAGADGGQAMNDLALALGADVAASTDLTGSAALGGNWALEAHTGHIEARALQAASWDGLLLGPNVAPIALPDIALVNEDSSVDVHVLLNDIDLNGDPLTVTTASALHGTVNINPNGSLTYTPNANFNGLDAISYTVRDPGGLTSGALVAVTVLPTIDLPTIQLPTLNLFTEDTPIIFASVLGTQISLGNIDGSIVHVSLHVPLGDLTLSQTANLNIIQGTGAHDSTLTIEGSVADVNAALNGLVYTPGADYNGPVTISIDLGQIGIPLQLQVALPILGIAPVADIVDDHVNGTVNQPVNFNVLANDTFENSGRVVSSYTTPTHGSVSIDAQGNATYNPQGGYIGTDTFTYTVTSNGTHETATVTVTVGAAANQAPTAVGTLAHSQANDAQSVNLATASAFNDPDGDALSFSATGLPAGLSIDTHTGVISGTVDGHASQGGAGGDYNVAVTANDGRGGTVQQHFVLTIVNPAPTAVNDSGSGHQGVPITGNVLANDSDPDGDALSVNTTPVALPQHGTVLLLANGSYVYTPTLNYHGSDSFSYQVIDADGGVAVATVNLNVAAVNTPPITVGSMGAADANDGSTVSIQTANHFVDIDGDSLSYSASGLPTGLSMNAVTGVISGTLASNASSAVAGGVYTVMVTANDGLGGTTSQSFSLTAHNLLPIANSDTASANEDTPITGNVLANDTDPDGDALSVNTTNVALPQHGTLVLHPDGSYVYTPDANFHGVDSFTYQLVDADGGLAVATVTMTINAVNDAPTTVGSINAVNANDGSTLSLPTAANFADVDGDTLTYSATGLPAGVSIDAGTGLISGTLASNASSAVAGGVYAITVTAGDGLGGTVSQVFNLTATNVLPVAANDVVSGNEDTVISGNVLANDIDPDGDALSVNTTPVVAPQHGMLVLNPNGSYAYTPNANFHGVDSFTYQLVDADGGLAVATVTMTVNAVNDAPTTVGTLGAVNANDGSSLTLPTASTFVDVDGDTLAYSATGLPAGLSIDAGTGLISGTLASNASSSVANGVYVITVTADDGLGGSVSQVFSLTANNVLPVASNDVASGNEDTVISGNVLSNDLDPDGDALSVNATPVVAPQHGTLVLHPDGSYAYTPNANYNGVDSFSYQLVDADGGQAVATVTMTVNAVNDAPATVGSITAVQANDGSWLTLPTATHFTDVDGDTLSYAATGLPAGLSINAGTGVIFGTLSSSASSAVAGGVYAITVTADDGHGGTVVQAFNLTASNLAPVAGNDVAAGNEDTVISGNVLSNDFDPDGDALTVNTTPVAPPQHGALVLHADGSYTYTPNANFNGADSFSYQLVDADGGTSVATVTVAVANVNDAPIAVGTPGTVQATDSSTVSIAMASAFSDTDGDALGYAAVGLPSGLSIDPTTGVISGTLPNNASTGGAGGVYTVTVTANDGHSGIALQTMAIQVSNPNPTAVGDTASGNEGSVISGNLMANDHDPDGDFIWINTTPVQAPQHGQVVMDIWGGFTYTPNAHFNGTDTFSYQVLDTDGGASVATVTVGVGSQVPNLPPTVTPVNTPISQPSLRSFLPDNQVDSTQITLNDTLDQSIFAPAVRLVLIEAVNNVQSLDAMGDLATDMPLLAAVDAIHDLSNNMDIGNASPMEQAAGDMHGANKEGPRVDRYSTDPFEAFPLDLQSLPEQSDELEDPNAPVDESPIQLNGIEKELSPEAALPITLSAQLRVATLHRQWELDALVKALA